MGPILLSVLKRRGNGAEAAYHAPGAAVEYAKDTWTLNPSNVDWDRTLKPWKW